MADRSENTAVNRLIEMVQSRPIQGADDGLFERPRATRPTLPPPFPSRNGIPFAPASVPEPMPRNRVPSSTHTSFEGARTTLVGVGPMLDAPPTPSPRPDPTEPFDVLEDAEDLDDDLLMTVDEPELAASGVISSAPAPAKVPVVAADPVLLTAVAPAAAVAEPAVSISVPADPTASIAVAEEPEVDEFALAGETAIHTLAPPAEALAGAAESATPEPQGEPTAPTVLGASPYGVEPAAVTAPPVAAVLAPSAPVPVATTLPGVGVPGAATAASRATILPAGAAAALSQSRGVPARPSPAEGDHWFQPSVAMERVDEFVVGTQAVVRPSRWRGALWLVLAFAAGVVVAAAVAWPRATAPGPSTAMKLAPTEPPAASTSPIAVPPVAAAPAEGVAPSPAAIPAAPVATDSAAVTAAGEKVAVAAPARDAAVTSAPAATAEIRTEPRPAAKTAAAPAKALAVSKAAAVSKASASTKAAPAKAAPAKVAATKPTTAAKAAATKPADKAAPGAKAGKATLMLGAKPPCDIYVDGKSLGLKTPQRSLQLAAGDHKITLVNKQYRITETFSVSLKAGTSTKVIKDLTKKMK